MAFKLTLVEDSDAELNVLLSADESLARIPIGTDDETGDILGVLVALVEMPGMGPTHRELMFFLYKYGADADDFEEWNDGLQTQPFLKGGDRALVLAAICVAAKAIVEDANPETISITTVRSGLPDQALVKYERVCHAIATLSYKYGQVDQYLGTRQWLLTKNQ